MAIAEQPTTVNPEVLIPTTLAEAENLVAPFNVPREAYVVDEALMDAYESSLVTELEAIVEPEGSSVVTVIVPWDSPYANFGRMSETLAYTGYDNHAAMQAYEARSIWLFTVELTPGASGIDHVKRLVPAMTEEDRAATGLTGIEVIDDRLTATDPAEVADLASLMDYHGITDLNTVWNVTSNHSTGRVHPEKSMEGGMNTMRSYKATYMLGKRAGVEHLFAYLNNAAIKSLGRTGVQPELMLGGDFHLPEPNGEGYDENYRAVDIPYTPENQACFTEVFSFEPTGDDKQDARLAFRAGVSDFLANEVVRVYQVGESTKDDIPTITRSL